MTCLSYHTDLEKVMSRNCLPSLDFSPLVLFYLFIYFFKFVVNFVIH